MPVHPYDDERVMAGQGTAALELLEDARPARRRCSSASAAAGCCPAARPRSRRSRPTRASSASSPRRATTSCARSRRASASGSTVPRTIADGQQLPIPGELTFPVIQELVDEVVTVSDAEIVDAMRLLFERAKTVTEPSGACAFAALLAGKVDAAGLRVGRDALGRQRRPRRARASRDGCAAARDGGARARRRGRPR